MLLGFFGCAVMKIYITVSGATLPIFLDPFFVGLALNILGLVVGSMVTQVTTEENAMRQTLLLQPKAELDGKCNGTRKT